MEAKNGFRFIFLLRDSENDLYNEMVDIARFRTLLLLSHRKKTKKQENYSGQSQYEVFSQFSEPIKLQSKFM